jgi:hypothetical protein
MESGDEKSTRVKSAHGCSPGPSVDAQVRSLLVVDDLLEQWRREHRRAIAAPHAVLAHVLAEHAAMQLPKAAEVFLAERNARRQGARSGRWRIEQRQDHKR